ncbi:MAG: hypothetical protein ACJ75H_15865 [Thermoanaerobaculia bacterium]
MRRRNVHRGMAALAIVTSMAFAGARPAAAESLGLLDRLAGLWSSVTAPAPGIWSAVTNWFTLDEKATTTQETDRGWGLDPNGNSSVQEPTVTGSEG